MTPSKPPPPYEQLLPLPTPYFKMFLERSLNEPHPPPPHFKHLSLLPPSPSTTPSLPPPPKNFDHTHVCRLNSSTYLPQLALKLSLIRPSNILLCLSEVTAANSIEIAKLGEIFETACDWIIPIESSLHTWNNVTQSPLTEL